jgi:hypothetical protein
MKTLIAFLLAAFVLGARAETPAAGASSKPTASAPTRYIIGLTPFLENAKKDDVFRRIVGMALEDLPLKSSLTIYDAYNMATIAKIEVPGSRAFKSGKTRANQFKEPVEKLRRFLAEENPKPAAGKLNLDQAVRFPQFLDFISENLAVPDESLVVIVIGSPLYLDHKEPGFSMVDGYFPSDGHIMASRDKTVYGLKEHANSLKNGTVHFGYFGDPWVSAIHQEKIIRFWNIYLKEQGAHLGAFANDLTTLFNAARPGAVEEKVLAARDRRDELDKSQTKVEMLRISRDIGAEDWITRDLAGHRRQPPPSKTAGPMKIGIRWKGDIDLDLYAAASGDAETLFFEHTRSPEGYYFKDHRHSPEREYEFIEFEKSVDVFRVDASINFYAGNLPTPPSGEVRIEFEGRIYAAPFTLVATRGNKGRSGSGQGDFWARIDVPRILGLQAGSAARAN